MVTERVSGGITGSILKVSFPYFDSVDNGKEEVGEGGGRVTVRMRIVNKRE